MDESLNLKPVKKINIAVVILLILFVVFAFISTLCYYTDKKENKYFKECTATISSIRYQYTSGSSSNKNYDAYVDYVVDGILYKDIKLNVYVSTWDEGDKVKILYDIRNPRRIKYDMFINPSSLIFGILALIPLTAMIIIITVNSTSKKRRLKLKELESPCRATIVDIIMDNNKMHLKCEYDNSFFISDEYHYNENVYTGCTIDIYINKVALAEAKMMINYSKTKTIYNKKCFYIDPNSIEKGTTYFNQDYDVYS